MTKTKNKDRGAFNKRLDAILAELEKRDLTEIPTEKLLKLALIYAEKAKAERLDHGLDFLEG